MSKRYDHSPMFLAPGVSGYASMVLPGANQPHWPPVDEHAVEPETREEMIDGRIVHAAPAGPPHGDRHFDLDFVLRASVAPGYVGSTDMLTRTSDRWNFAADASIRKQGIDPATGHRYLEELAFEVKHTQRMSDLTARARQLVDRGVRRVFVICVRGQEEQSQEQRKQGKGKERIEAGPVMEWDAASGGWIELDADGYIEDPCLCHPIRVRALLDATEADNAVVRALEARGNPLLKKMQEDAEQQGRAQGLREALVTLCRGFAIELTPERRAHIDALVDALDAAGLQALLDRIAVHHRWDA